MPEIRVTPLGAGQDVGRSCILVSIAGKNVMLDCGMHMGFNDDRRFPDFSYITQNGRLTDFLDCVIISHFHLDHCGALPYFSEMVGYDGPIYMTHPTQAICPILLEDYRKIAVDKKGEANFFTSQMIKDCMKKVVAVHLHQTSLPTPTATMPSARSPQPLEGWGLRVSPPHLTLASSTVGTPGGGSASTRVPNKIGRQPGRARAGWGCAPASKPTWLCLSGIEMARVGQAGALRALGASRDLLELPGCRRAGRQGPEGRWASSGGCLVLGVGQGGSEG
uniref:Metallo-beta-lactamase domain-containing protein n=1 Tax=Theropithecus gelada TaxID=9565 RepID=A0A8D2K4Y6_THEGE